MDITKKWELTFSPGYEVEVRNYFLARDTSRVSLTHAEGAGTNIRVSDPPTPGGGGGGSQPHSNQQHYMEKGIEISPQLHSV